MDRGKLNPHDKKKPIISVITTAYNAEKFVLEAIESILGQSWSDFEYIIIDDGSTDRTADMIESIEDPRVSFVRSGRIGRGKALNLALKQAQGRYIAIQDADDISLPNRFSVQLEFMKKAKGHAAITSEVVRIRNSQRIGLYALSQVDRSDIKLSEITKQICYFNPMKHSSAIIPRDSLLRIGGYNDIRKNLFDWDMFSRHVANGGKLYLISMPLIVKRLHRDQFFESKNRADYVLSSVKLQYQIMKNFGRKKLILLLPFLMVYRFLPSRMRMLLRATVAR